MPKIQSDLLNALRASVYEKMYALEKAKSLSLKFALENQEFQGWHARARNADETIAIAERSIFEAHPEFDQNKFQIDLDTGEFMERPTIKVMKPAV